MTSDRGVPGAVGRWWGYTRSMTAVDTPIPAPPRPDPEPPVPEPPDPEPIPGPERAAPERLDAHTG